MTSEQQVERRRFPRRTVIGVAHVITAARYAGVFFIENLSAGGVLLVGEPRLPLGTSIRILLEIHGGRRIGVDGQVVRHAFRNGRHLSAAVFQNVSTATRNELDTVVREAVQHLLPTVLVVDVASTTSGVLIRDLAQLGRYGVCIGTVLDMIAWLHASDVRIEALMVGSGFVHTAGAGILEFVATDYPATRRVLVVDSDDCETPIVETTGAVQLSDPWTLPSLASALGFEMHAAAAQGQDR